MPALFIPQNWTTRSLPEQLANIGSEVHRAFSWQQRGDNTAAQQSWDRALDLLDATISTSGYGYERLRELLRLREVCCTFINEKPIASSEIIEQYFLSFALFVAQNR